MDSPRLEILVIADRPGAPVELPVKGVEPAHWTSVEGIEGPALMLRTGGLEYGRQVFAWDGHALVPRETELFYWECFIPAHGWTQTCSGVGVAGGKNVHTNLDEGPVERVESPDGSELWDLQGDGSRFYVIDHTYVPRPGDEDERTRSRLVFELRKDGWVERSPLPVNLATMADRDSDGLPEFEAPQGTLRLATCAKRSRDCAQLELDAEVVTPAAWNGKNYSVAAPKLAGASMKWLASARERATTLRRESDPRSTCPKALVEEAARIYLGERRAGTSEAKALAEADVAMQGFTTNPCAKAGATPKPWAALRKELTKISAGSPHSL